MDLEANWATIRAIGEASIASSRHSVIASNSSDGRIHLAPIGHIFFRDDLSLFYFDAYAQRLSENADRNPRVTISFVNSGPNFWMEFLMAGRFSSAPGVRLYGLAGPRRAATIEELGRLAERIQAISGTPGSVALWNHLSSVRDIVIDDFDPVRYPEATDGLWIDSDG